MNPTRDQPRKGFQAAHSSREPAAHRPHRRLPFLNMGFFPRGLRDFGEHTRTARCVKSDDMPLRGMSSHTAARYCRVICGWGSAASSTHENENPANNNFAQGVDMPRETAKPAAACSPTQFYSV